MKPAAELPVIAVPQAGRPSASSSRLRFKGAQQGGFMKAGKVCVDGGLTHGSRRREFRWLVDPAGCAAGSGSKARAAPPPGSGPCSGRSRLGGPRTQAFQIPARRLTELPAVLAAELAGTVVADREADPGDVATVVQKAVASLLKADLLLVLQRAHRGHRLEVPMKRGFAHPSQFSQILDAHRL